MQANNGKEQPTKEIVQLKHTHAQALATIVGQHQSIPNVSHSNSERKAERKQRTQVWQAMDNRHLVFCSKAELGMRALWAFSDTTFYGFHAFHSTAFTVPAQFPGSTIFLWGCCWPFNSTALRDHRLRVLTFWIQVYSFRWEASFIILAWSMEMS